MIPAPSTEKLLKLHKLHIANVCHDYYYIYAVNLRHTQHLVGNVQVTCDVPVDNTAPLNLSCGFWAKRTSHGDALQTSQHPNAH
jgi:hypothetical protein